MAGNKICFAGLLALAFFSIAACSNKAENNAPDFVAYSWSPVPDNHANIIPFHWLQSADTVNMQAQISDAVRATQAMPQGHRVLFSWDIHRSMSFQENGDFLYTASGEVAGCNSENGFKPYRSLWWDNGIEKVRRYFTDFFKLYRQAGGELDVFVLDFEQGFSYWHLVDLVEKNYSCGLDHYLDAMQNDSRFSQVRDSVAINDLKSIKLWYENDDHLRWQAFAWAHLASYIDRAIYGPLRDYFPNADFSNYGYYYQSSRFDLPDIHGTYTHRYTDGIHVGTHQSREIYGWMNLPAGTVLEGMEYSATPFNAFRFAVNKVRAMLLSSAVPVSPWVGYKGFDQSHLKDNDFYQELIYHILLSGVDYLLYWNPSQQADYSSEDDRLLNQLIGQVNGMTNNRKLSAMTRELVSWLDNLVITKAELAEHIEVWRVTADIGLSQDIGDMIIQAEPAIIKINDSVYKFDSMKVWDEIKPLSDKGIWLITK